MTATELSAVIRGVVPAVKEYVSGLTARVAALEAREPVVGKDGRDGRDGVDGEKGADGLTIVGKDGEPGPAGEKGMDGMPGAKGDKGDPGEMGPCGPAGECGPMGLLGPMGPQGPSGDKGDPGECGPMGPAGPQGEPGMAGKAADVVTPAQILSALESHPQAFEKAISLYLEKHPIRDGRDGENGAAGQDGRDGLPGIPGRNGDKGEDGTDGLGFDDVDVEYDGERAFAVVFKRGDRRKHCGTFTLPIPIYRGVYEENRSYQRGDTVTWGGSQWHANQPTKAKPGGSEQASRAWQLCVKKGTDGKAGKP